MKVSLDQAIQKEWKDFIYDCNEFELIKKNITPETEKYLFEKYTLENLVSSRMKCGWKLLEKWEMQKIGYDPEFINVFSLNNRVIEHKEKYLEKISKAGKGRKSPFRGIPLSEEIKIKISGKLKGREISEEHKKKVSEAKKGKDLSEDHKRKITESNKSRVWDEETRKKMSETKKGTILSEEHKRKISIGITGREVSEETRKKISESNKGKERSEETRKKLSELHIGKKLSSEHVEKLSKVHRERERSQKEIENRVSSYMNRPYAKYKDKIWTYTDLVSELGFKDKNRLSKIKGGRYKNDIGVEFI
jgi:hypothetical protein